MAILFTVFSLFILLMVAEQGPQEKNKAHNWVTVFWLNINRVLYQSRCYQSYETNYRKPRICFGKYGSSEWLSTKKPPYCFSLRLRNLLTLSKRQLSIFCLLKSVYLKSHYIQICHIRICLFKADHQVSFPYVCNLLGERKQIMLKYISHFNPLKHNLPVIDFRMYLNIHSAYSNKAQA